MKFLEGYNNYLGYNVQVGLLSATLQVFLTVTKSWSSLLTVKPFH